VIQQKNQHIREELSNWEMKPFNWFAISTTFYFAKPERSKLKYPGHNHGDVDNLQKEVLDALAEAGIIGDDSRCVSSSEIKEWSKLGDYIVIKITAR
jgi:Holliday junction resolvase RusA-like endonuclease